MRCCLVAFRVCVVDFCAAAHSVLWHSLLTCSVSFGRIEILHDAATRKATQKIQKPGRRAKRMQTMPHAEACNAVRIRRGAENCTVIRGALRSGPPWIALAQRGRKPEPRTPPETSCARAAHRSLAWGALSPSVHTGSRCASVQVQLHRLRRRHEARARRALEPAAGHNSARCLCPRESAAREGMSAHRRRGPAMRSNDSELITCPHLSSIGGFSAGRSQCPCRLATGRRAHPVPTPASTRGTRTPSG